MESYDVIKLLAILFVVLVFRLIYISEMECRIEDKLDQRRLTEAEYKKITVKLKRISQEVRIIPIILIAIGAYNWGYVATLI